MADQKISQLTSLTGANTASGDLVTIVDISDSTMGASGTNKKMTLTEFQASPVSAGTANGVVFLNGTKVETSGSALTFDGTNLGVGTTSPNSRLTVQQANNTGDGIRLFANGNDSQLITRYLLSIDAWQVTASFASTGAYKPITWWTSDLQRMTLDASGNLGIGTTSPGNRLHVQSSGDISRFTNGTVSLYGYSDSAGLGWFTGAGATGTGVYYNNTSSYQALYTGGTERMRLDASGNLGIGTTSPATALEIARGAAAAAGASFRGNGNSAANEFFVGQGGAGNGFVYQRANSDISFGTNNTTRMFIDALGNVGINTLIFGTSAAGVLSLGTGTAPTTGPADTVQLFSVDRTAGNTIPAVRCEGSGVTNAGITSTTVTNKIAVQVNGTIYYLLATTSAT